MRVAIDDCSPPLPCPRPQALARINPNIVGTQRSDRVMRSQQVWLEQRRNRRGSVRRGDHILQMRRPAFEEKLCDRIELARTAGRIVGGALWHPDHRLISRPRQQHAVGVDLIGNRGLAARLLPACTCKRARDPMGMAIAANQVIAPTQADQVELQILTCRLCRRHFRRI
jgi:hypothetical protein